MLSADVFAVVVFAVVFVVVVVVVVESVRDVLCGPNCVPLPPRPSLRNPRLFRNPGSVAEAWRHVGALRGKGSH